MQSTEADKITENQLVPVQPMRIGHKLILENLTRKLYRETQTPHPKTPNAYIMAVSNGSVKQGIETFGWIKVNKQGQEIMMNGEVEGNLGTINSFQMEAQGLVNLLWSPGISKNTKIYLDNKSVVKKVNEEYPLHPMQSKWELLKPARKKIQKENLQVQHVKGHQDNTKKILAQEEKLNIKADKLVAEAYHNPQTSGYTPAGYAALLYINGN